MTTVEPMTKLQRDISFLKLNKVPIEVSGLKVEKLDYEKEGLTDDDVKALAEALCLNDTFQGPLDLSKNELTDLVSYQF